MKIKKNHIFLLIFIIFIIIFSLQKIDNFDIWWHLRTGKWIWQNKAVPHYEIFSYTHEGKEWIDFTWGFQSIAYIIYHFFDINGLIIFKSLIIVIIFFFLYKNLQLLTQNSIFIFVLLIWAFLISSFRLMVRPHILSFLFIVIFLYGLNFYCKQRKVKYLLILIPIYILWINTHGSFIMAILLTGAYLFGEVCMNLKVQVKDAFKIVSIRDLTFFLLSLIILSIVNPYGYKLLYFVLFSHSGESKESLYHIVEWRRLPFKALFCFNLGKRVLYWQLLFWSLFFIFIGHIFFSIYKKRHLNFLILRDIIIFIIFTYLCLKHFRFSAIFTFVMIPVFAYWTNELLRYKVTKFILLGLFLLMIYFSVKITYFDHNFKKNLGFGIVKVKYPIYVTEFLKQNSIKGNIFNTYGFGGYLIWKLYPKYKVFIDGRTPTIYPVNFFWQYRIIEGGNTEVFKKIQKKYNINIVITKKEEFAHQLIKTKNWKLIAFDDKSFLVVKKEVLQKNIKPFETLDMTQDIKMLIKKCKENNTIDLLEKELKRALSLFPKVIKVNMYAGIFYYKVKNNYQKAKYFFQKCIMLDPYDFRHYYNMGLILKEKNENKEAIFYFHKALKFNKRFYNIYYQLGSLSFEEKQYKQAIKYLKKYCKMTDDHASGISYQYLGLSYYYTFELDKAEKYLKRALLLAKEKEDIRNTYYNLGNVYYLKSEYKKAIKYYKKVLKIDPNFEKAKFIMKKVREKLFKKNKKGDI